MPQYKLIYFDYTGYAEPIRLALTHAGVPFEDVRNKYEFGWQAKIQSPFGKLPVLEVDGKQLPESLAILRFVGEKHALQASDPWDRALGDALATSINDFSPVYDTLDFTTMKWDIQKIEKLMKELVSPRFKYFDEHLSKSKSGYFAGDKLTWVDFHVFANLETMKIYFRAPLDEFPHLAKFYKKMQELSSVKSWRQSHPIDMTWGGIAPLPYDDK